VSRRFPVCCRSLFVLEEPFGGAGERTTEQPQAGQRALAYVPEGQE